MEMYKVIIFEFQDLRFASRARKEAFSLSKHNYDVTLVGYNRILKIKKTIEKGGITFIEYPYINFWVESFFQKVVNIIYMNYMILNLVMNNRYDIYHMHNLNLIFPALYARIFKKKVLIYDAHELHIKKRIKKTIKNMILNSIDEVAERLLNKLSFSIIQASDLRANYYSKYYQVEKPIVVENHAELVKSSNKFKSLHSILGLPEEVKLIIFTGYIRLNSNQKIENVIYALNFVPEFVHLCLLGSADNVTTKSLRHIADKNNVAHRLHMLPAVLSEDVVDYISSADLGVIPIIAYTLNSEYSALNKLSQYLMAGLPIISTDYENLRHIIKYSGFGEVGDVFDINDPRDIARSILYVFENNDIGFGDNAARLAIKQLNWGIEEKKLLNLYRSIFKS